MRILVLFLKTVLDELLTSAQRVHDQKKRKRKRKRFRQRVKKYIRRTMKIYHRRLSNLFNEYDARCSGPVVAPAHRPLCRWRYDEIHGPRFRTITASNSTNVLIRGPPVAKTLFARHGNDLSLFCLSTALHWTAACCILFSLSVATGEPAARKMSPVF